MNNTNTGGPAFPIKQYNRNIMAFEEVCGMTMRDYFATKALPISYQFWMTDYYHPDAADSEMRSEDDRGDFSQDMKTLMAETAYEMADAMMKAREA